jgi:hypothetical protein
MWTSDIGPRDLVIELADNAQWKVLFGQEAQKGTFLHWIVTAYRIEREKDLIEAGMIHDGPANVDKRLSRKRKDWVADVLQRKTPDQILDDIFRPRAADYNELCSLITTHVAATLEAAVSSLPSIEECSKMVDKKSFLVQKDKALPLLHRVFDGTDVELIRDRVFEHESVESGEEPLVVDADHCKLVTLWDINHIRASFPVQMPFVSTEAIVEMLEMVKRIGDRQIDTWGCFTRRREGREGTTNFNPLFWFHRRRCTFLSELALERRRRAWSLEMYNPSHRCISFLHGNIQNGEQDQ